MKSDGHLDRNYLLGLLGADGDRINAVLCGLLARTSACSSVGLRPFCAWFR